MSRQPRESSDVEKSGVWLTPADVPAGAFLEVSKSWERARPEVSLVTATLGSPVQIRELVLSLNDEWDSETQFEYLLIDLDGTARCLDEVRAHARFPWLYVCYPSAVNANIRRNLGTQLARGAWIGYPMDDDRYTGTTLATLLSLGAEHPTAVGICGRIVDTRGRSAVLRWPKKATRVTRWNNHRTAFCPGMFLRRETIEAVGLFALDFGLGVDTWYWAGDDSDLALRAAAHGQLRFDPRLVVVDTDTGDQEITRRLRYGGGCGAAWRKADLSPVYVAYLVVRKLANTWINLLRGRRDKARYHAAWARGVVFGFRRRVPAEFAAHPVLAERRDPPRGWLVPMLLFVICLTIAFAVLLAVLGDGLGMWLVAPAAIAVIALTGLFASPLGWRCDRERRLPPSGRMMAREC